MLKYINYLEETANTVKNQKKSSVIILIAIYLGIWAIALSVFWFFCSRLDAMGYSIMFFWILLPVTIFIISLFIGENIYFRKSKVLLSIFFGIMYMFAEYLTFSTKNMISFKKFNFPEFMMILVGSIISLLGMIIGFCIRRATSYSSKKSAR